MKRAADIVREHFPSDPPALAQIVAMVQVAQVDAINASAAPFRQALQEIADTPDNVVALATVQRMRNIAGFALIGGRHAD